MKHYLLILTAALVAFNASAQKTEKLTASKGNDYGLVYTLPKTAVDITVETETTVKKRGEFANYARMRLGINDAVTEPSTRVTVKSITIGTRGVPDGENRWIAQFKPGSNVSILLDEGGIPLAINADAVDEAEPQELPEAVPMPVSPLDKPVARQVLTQEMIRSTSLSKKAELAAAKKYRQMSGPYLITGVVRVHTMKAGDNLYLLAKKEYGNKEMVSYIIFHNQISNPDLIRLGQQIEIPRLTPKE